MDRRKRIIREFLLAVSILLLFSIIFWSTNLDILLQSFFYQEGQGWYMGDSFPWRQLYDYGMIPTLLIFLIGLFIIIAGFFMKGLKKYRKIAIFTVLLLFIGSGLIVNFIFKDHWGRPRPREIIQYGGDYQFVPHWLMGESGKNSSFPSGHASGAFFLIFPYFYYKGRKPKKALGWLLFGIAFGLLEGLARMIQGGHFASDVIWSAGFIYLTGLALYYILKLDQGLYTRASA